MNKPTIPTVIASDVQSFKIEDTPDAFIHAIAGMICDDEQKRIVDASEAPPAGVFPSGLTRDELIAWMKETFGV
jgi:hypothetical protein